MLIYSLVVTFILVTILSSLLLCLTSIYVFVIGYIFMVGVTSISITISTSISPDQPAYSLSQYFLIIFGRMYRFVNLVVSYNLFTLLYMTVPSKNTQYPLIMKI